MSMTVDVTACWLCWWCVTLDYR